MKTKLAICLLILCSLLIMASTWKIPNAPEIFWYVLGGGGGRVTNGSLVVEGTIGQSVAGLTNQSPFELCSGYWCGASSACQVFLPLILR